jgi:hypothetical protein
MALQRTSMTIGAQPPVHGARTSDQVLLRPSLITPLLRNLSSVARDTTGPPTMGTQPVRRTISCFQAGQVLVLAPPQQHAA